MIAAGTSTDAAAIFDPLRPKLTRIAYRMLGSVADAEDVVQDAFIRWLGTDRAAVREPEAFLRRVVTRLCLDQIKSAHRQRVTYVGEWLPEPMVEAEAETAMEDDVTLPLMLALERLSPLERAAFLLHDVFGIPFESVAETVGRTPAACRQLASRARRAIRESSLTPEPPPHPDPELQDVVDSFIAACAGGDLDALARVLHPDVSGWSTIRGRRVGFGAGVDQVAVGSLHYLGPGSGWILAPLPLDDGMAVVATRDGDPVALIRLLITDGLIAAIHTVLLR